MSHERERTSDGVELDKAKKRNRFTAFESLFEPQPNEENFPNKQKKRGRGESAWATYIGDRIR